MLGCVGVGTGQQEAVIGVVPSGRPHLLTIDDPFVAIEHRCGLQRRQIRAGVRFTESLAPPHGAVENAREELFLLLLGTPLKDRRAHQRVAEEVGAHRRFGLGELFGEHDTLHGAETLPAVFLRPRGADPPSGVQLLRPLLVERLALLQRHLEGLVAPAFRQVRRQPIAYLGAELLCLGGVRNAHRDSIDVSPNHRRVHRRWHQSRDLHCVHTYHTVAKSRPPKVLPYGHRWSCSPGSTHKPPRVSAGRAGADGPQRSAHQPWAGHQPPRTGSACRARRSQRAPMRQPPRGNSQSSRAAVGRDGAQPWMDAERRGRRRRVHPHRRATMTQIHRAQKIES